MRVLILGGGLQGLACAMSLYKEHEVSAVASDLMSKRSRFFKHVYTDINGNSEELFDLLKSRHFDVLLPVSDRIVPFVSRNKKEIEKEFGIKCAVPDYAFVYIVEDKSRFITFCEDNDVPHPRTIQLSMDNLYDAASLIGFPSLIKPNYSVGARGITKVESIKQLNEMFPVVNERYGSCSLQEFIDNKEYYFNVMLFRDREGNYPAYTILKIVRVYPLGAGSSACCVIVENDELLRICKDCLDKMGWVGMADFDVLQRLDTMEYKVIEINPRVPASLRGAEVSGVRFPQLIVDDAIGNSISDYNYVPGKVLRYLGIDILWFISSPRKFRTKPSWFSFFGKDVYYQDIYKEDVTTWWTWLVEGLSKISKRNKKIR